MGADFSYHSSVLDALTEIALDMRWSWNHAADDLWSQLDPELWELTRNPWTMLQTVSRERLKTLSADDSEPFSMALLALRGSGAVNGVSRLHGKVSRHLDDHWREMGFTAMQVESDAKQHHFRVDLHLDEMRPDAVQVELYAEPTDGGEPMRITLVREEQRGGENSWRYTATVPAERPAGDFTPRVIPHHPEAIVPLEAAQILWYR